MEKYASRLAIGLLLLASLSQAGQVRPGQCGFDRWSVKTLTDRDRNRVDFKPVDTTVAKLTAIPIHEIPYPEDSRIEPEELRVYRVRAKLIQIRSEKDKDLHLILADLENSQVRMIAEIPAPECAKGSGREEDFRHARDAVASLARDATIEVVGVGFFDYIHNATGAAKNGIELHPVLSIQRVDSRKE